MSWKLVNGYKNKRYFCFHGRWDLCIYEDSTARKNRFCVREMSRTLSRHDELEGPEGAKVALLRRLIELAERGTPHSND